ncbi:hypothetical protein ATO10_02245 [Actibacterium atlanticum]|uniref:Antifreeze glycopeptide polyprotein n=1 Tax=Actibacterium atlanticum TaxID=1461693 RepID=A0A058ZPN7_9RHOB|nr:hypothetical protein [Actibacterium atlanticum]KCV83543.1 hypothetical protein ATO10_02245 [Actibacterium atlanticum]
MRSKALTLALIWAAHGALAQDGPLSAIDWLSDSVTPPVVAPAPDIPESAAPELVTVAPLDGPVLDAAGLLPPSMTGLPKTLWGSSSRADLAALIRSERADTLPAVQSLLYTLLLAELAPPQGEGADGTLLLARLDKLLALGALDQAQALLERAGPTHPELFRRWFDVSLLTGQEDRACAAMRAAPDIAPTFQARIFCLARGGDWNAAALSLETGRTLGYITAQQDAILTRFLVPELDEGATPLPIPNRPSPLVFRMFEAIGEPLPTATAPLAFAQADLRPTAGWKAQLEAAERLGRSGAIPANRLLGIYTERRPAASGGVWDRVAAVQKLDVAILSGDAAQVAMALPGAWQAMQAAELEVPFASLYGARLAQMDLPPAQKSRAFRMGLLSDTYETIARNHEPQNRMETFLRAVAQGDLGGLTPPNDLARAVLDGFSTPTLSEPMQARLNDGRLGEAILVAIDLITDGSRGDLSDVSEALAVLRHLGLEDTARRSALELLILERRG